MRVNVSFFFFFFQAEDGIRDLYVTGVQTCALPIWGPWCPALQNRQSWAQRTSPPCSFVTYPTFHAVLHLVGGQQAPSLLWRGISPLHHHELLSPATAARKAAAS